MVGGSLFVTPVSSTTKTGRHDIVEILLKVALSTQKSNQINHHIIILSPIVQVYSHVYILFL
jgi:hypothetical protein